MGFFENHLSSLGRSLDSIFECAGDWFRDRSRAIVDRRGHARRFEDIRDRVARSAEATRSGIGNTVDETRSRWQRRDSDNRSSRVQLATATGIVLVCAATIMLGRAWVITTPRPVSQTERDLLQRVQARQQLTTPGNPGLDHWVPRP